MTFNRCLRSNRRYLYTATYYSHVSFILYLAFHGVLSCWDSEVVSISDARKILKNSWADSVHVIVDLLEALSWNRYLLVTDEYAEVSINELMSATVATHVEVSQNTSDQQIHTKIIEAYNRRNGKLDFFIFCEITCILRVVQQAQLFDRILGERTALAHMARWIVVTEFQHKDVIENCLSNLNNVALITEHCVQSGANQQVMNKTGWTELRHRPTRTSISSNSTLYGQNTCNIEIHAALWKHDGRRFDLIGKWSRDQRLHLYEEVFPNLNFGFNSQTFNVVTNTWPAFVMLNETSGDYEGICMEILRELSSMLNFTYRLYLPEDGEWGALKEDGSWSGVIGELQHRRANLMAAPLAVTFEREQAMDFIDPFYYECLVVLVKKRTDDLWKIPRLFSYQIYVLIAVSLVLMSLLVYHCERMNPHYTTRGLSLQDSRLYPFHNAFWYLFGALLWQGGNHLPTSQTGRTLLISWWLYCLVLMATFGGQLKASLTLSQDVAPFNTLNEMVQQNEYTWGTQAGSALIDLFKRSSVTVYKRVWDGFKAETDSLPKNHTKHLEMVQRGGYAYMNAKSGMLEWTSKDCDLLLIREEFFPHGFAFGLPDQSPYSNIFSEAMLKIVQSGLIEKWKKAWQPVEQCKRQVEVQAKSIQLDDV